MKKTLLLALFISTYSFAQDCCNVVDSNDVTVITSNGECVSTTEMIATACADQDGDGVIDSEDKCPTIAGTINGCPDSDADGVIDSKDKCPSIAGTVNGCPDSDKDGVIDSEDKCPYVAGTVNGCIDTDGDGVADFEDKCKDVKGTEADGGCPKITEEAKAALAEYPKTILFYTGKSSFKPGVTNTLKKIADLMKQYNGTSYTINGHTDSVGSDESNLKLSQARVKAIANYLSTQGVDISKVKTKGFGESNPTATNNTSAGRAKNRRVEILAE